MSIQQFYFDVDDCKIAPYTATDTYGTAVDVMAISRVSAQVEMVSAELAGDAHIVDTHARAVKMRTQLRFGFYELAPYEVLTGLSIQSVGATKEWIKFTNFNPPHFGMIFQIKATNGTGDMHLFMPKCKLMEGFSMGSEYGQYVTPELTIDCVLDDTYGIFLPLKHATATSLVIPVSLV